MAHHLQPCGQISQRAHRAPRNTAIATSHHCFWRRIDRTFNLYAETAAIAANHLKFDATIHNNLPKLSFSFFKSLVADRLKGSLRLCDTLLTFQANLMPVTPIIGCTEWSATCFQRGEERPPSSAKWPRPV